MSDWSISWISWFHAFSFELSKKKFFRWRPDSFFYYIWHSMHYTATHPLYDISFWRWTFSCTRFWKWKSRSHCWYNWSETSKHSCKSLARLSYKEKMSSLLLTTKIAMNCEINGKMISCCYQVSKLFNLQCQSLSLRHFQIHFNIRYIFKHDIILFWKHSM